MFAIPNKLNGTQLRDELRAAGVKISDEKSAVTVSDADLILQIDENDYTKALNVVKAHIGVDVVIDNSKAKAALLEKLGITEEEAKLLLS